MLKSNVWYPGKYTLDSTRLAINEQFDKYYGTAATWGGTDTSHDETNNRDAAERYFTLTTDFLEWGWGDAFHMAPVKPGWSFFSFNGILGRSVCWYISWH
mmetsp:Transcript_2511/g.3279  ORF Transcript_2511/g.3279 Transcript_2511/m.3279 type:complete len:100 (+) Transcript_2511:21-320(+)